MVAVAVGAAVISREGTGRSVTASSTPSLPSFSFAVPFPLWCFLEEPAVRCFHVDVRGVRPPDQYQLIYI